MRGLEFGKTGFETVEIEPTGAGCGIVDACHILADFYPSPSQAN